MDIDVAGVEGDSGEKPTSGWPQQGEQGGPQGPLLLLTLGQVGPSKTQCQIMSLMHILQHKKNLFFLKKTVRAVFFFLASLLPSPTISTFSLGRLLPGSVLDL